MKKEKDIFDPRFKKTRYYEITNINYDSSIKCGTAHLDSRHKNYYLIWSLKNYPMEVPIIPGALYPIQVNYTIFERCVKENKMYNSISGNFVYEINSGILPNLNSIGIPFNIYKSIGRNNLNNLYVDVIFLVTEEPLEIIIIK